MIDFKSRWWWKLEIDHAFSVERSKLCFRHCKQGVRICGRKKCVLRWWDGAMCTTATIFDLLSPPHNTFQFLTLYSIDLDKNGRKKGENVWGPKIERRVCGAKTRKAEFSGQKLWNTLSRNLRNVNNCSLDQFKELLDCFLIKVPDEPKTENLTWSHWCDERQQTLWNSSIEGGRRPGTLPTSTLVKATSYQNVRGAVQNGLFLTIEFMTIFLEWQSRVALDSIRDSWVCFNPLSCC